MMLWVAVIVAALIAFSLKLAGFLVPESALSHPRARRITAAIPIAMLAALVATLLLRAPFIVVVVLGAATAAALRALGWA